MFCKWHLIVGLILAFAASYVMMAKARHEFKRELFCFIDTVCSLSFRDVGEMCSLR